MEASGFIGVPAEQKFESNLTDSTNKTGLV